MISLGGPNNQKIKSGNPPLFHSPFSSLLLSCLYCVERFVLGGSIGSESIKELALAVSYKVHGLSVSTGGKSRPETARPGRM
jgi:hypothetical protein